MLGKGVGETIWLHDILCLFRAQKACIYRQTDWIKILRAELNSVWNWRYKSQEATFSSEKRITSQRLANIHIFVWRTLKVNGGRKNEARREQVSNIFTEKTEVK